MVFNLLCFESVADIFLFLDAADIYVADKCSKLVSALSSTSLPDSVPNKLNKLCYVLNPIPSLPV